MSDLVSFCMPNFGKCAPAVNDIVPNIKDAIQFFVTLEWIKFDGLQSGKDWKQNPFFAFWANIPLCCAFMFVPCCQCVVFLRTMEKMTGKSCESECLTCCVLQCLCGPLYNCYYAKKRTEMRKKYGLRGAPGVDCFLPCCCWPCMMCQDANELTQVPYCSMAASEELKRKINPTSS